MFSEYIFFSKGFYVVYVIFVGFIIIHSKNRLKTHTIFVHLSEFPITSKWRSDFSFIPSCKTSWLFWFGCDTQNGFSSSVSFSSKSSRTSITAILSISNISLTCWVRNPSTILGADRINIGSNRAVEFARVAQKPTGAIAWNAWAKTWDLLLYSRIVFNTSWNICPGSVFLKYGNKKEFISVYIVDSMNLSDTRN